MTFTKVDATTIKETGSKETLHRYDSLLAEKKSWQSRVQYMTDKGNEKIAKIDILIEECKKLGLKVPKATDI